MGFSFLFLLLLVFFLKTEQIDQLLFQPLHFSKHFHVSSQCLYLPFSQTSQSFSILLFLNNLIECNHQQQKKKKKKKKTKKKKKKKKKELIHVSSSYILPLLHLFLFESNQ